MTGDEDPQRTRRPVGSRGLGLLSQTDSGHTTDANRTHLLTAAPSAASRSAVLQPWPWS